MENFQISPNPVLFLVLSVLISSICCENLVNKTCKNTPYYDLCISSLQSNPQSSNLTVQDLASIVANVTLSNATNIRNYTQELTKNNTDTNLEWRLAYCAEVYISLERDILPQAIEALENGQIGFAKYGISAARDEVHECEKKIPESFEPPLNEMNRIVDNLCDVCVAIIDTLLKPGWFSSREPI